MAEPSGAMIREGACLCGAVRFRAAGAPEHVSYCHCRMCRKASGAPVVAWATYQTPCVSWIEGTPRWRRTSSFARRANCAECGTPLAWQGDAEPQFIDLALGCFDDASALPPADHIWTESRIAWFDTNDALPRHARERLRG